MCDDDAAGRLVPSAVVVEAAIGSDGANDAVCRRRVECGFLQDFFESESDASAALLEEAECVSVPVDRGAMAKLIFMSQFAGPSPHEEALLDGVAVRVIADGAVDAMVVEAGASALALVWPVALGSRGCMPRFGILLIWPGIEAILEV